jgi:alkylated DNA repair dioxygenase AlkB
MTNVVDYSNDTDNGVNQELITRMKHYPHLFQDAIRRAIQPFMDPSGDSDVNMNTNSISAETDATPNPMTEINLAPEIFVPSKKQLAPFKYCHIGTRSPAQAQAIIKQLQGRQIEITMDMDTVDRTESNPCTTNAITITTGKLYLDFADVTTRSAAKSNRMQSQDPSLKSEDSQQDTDSRGLGQPSKPECTSVTHSVLVPGLVIMKEFISEQEERVLLACLTGPHAPWAPVQTNKSKSGHVKRRVQHYGYVFDYESANVLRDRQDEDENGKAMCPPMPCLPEGYQNWNDGVLEDFMQKAVSDGSGWDVFAAIVERVRRYSFHIGSECNDNDDNECGTNNIVSQDDGSGSGDAGDRQTKPMSSGVETSTTDVSLYKRFQQLNQLTVNEYKRGQGIGAHIDTKSAFDDGLISISLGSDSVMEFQKENENGKQLKKLLHLPPRSLLLMSGPTRYEWSHQIVTRMTDCVDGVVIPRKTRVSLTLRTAITMPTTVLKGNQAGHVRPMDRVEGRSFPPRWGNQSKGGDDSHGDLGKTITKMP